MPSASKDVYLEIPALRHCDEDSMTSKPYKLFARLADALIASRREKLSISLQLVNLRWSRAF